MIKYYKEIEDRRNVYLPLVDYSAFSYVDIHDFKLPISFYDKYSKLFSYLETVLDDYKIINEKMIFEKYDRGLITYEELSIVSEMENIEYEDYSSISAFKNVEFSERDCDYYLRIMNKVLWITKTVFKEKKQYYDDIQKLNGLAINDLKKYHSIKIKRDFSRKIYLPDSWYVTPSGDLYNTCGKNGHGNSNLLYLFGDLETDFIEKKSIKEKYKKVLVEKKKIIDNGYITDLQFFQYLNFEYNFFHFDDNKDGCFNKSHIPVIINTVKGVVSAHEGFYSFFSDFQEYISNPLDEYKKLIKLTKGDKNDILVRCCGFHKVERCLEKTITTSSIKYEEEFGEYIKKGWKIIFLPPIIIQRELGIVTELDMDSCIVKKIVEKMLKKY